VSLPSDTESLSLEEPVKSASSLSDPSALCMVFLVCFHDGFGCAGYLSPILHWWFWPFGLCYVNAEPDLCKKWEIYNKGNVRRTSWLATRCNRHVVITVVISDASLSDPSALRVSDWKSGPVSVFDLQGLRQRPRLVHQSPNTSKNRTGLIKDHKKLIKTGLDRLLVLTGLSLKKRHIFINNVCWG